MVRVDPQQVQNKYLTCQSTLTNYGKTNDLVQMNPHQSIQTQLLPGDQGEQLLNISEDQKSNTQIIDLSQFNTLNENASAFRDDSTISQQNNGSKPASSFKMPINLITTGAYTVEHAGTVLSEDTQSYGTNIDFLNQVRAASCIT